MLPLCVKGAGSCSISLIKNQRRRRAHPGRERRQRGGSGVTIPDEHLRPPPPGPGRRGDPEDDLVLATGRLARADYLVTGDRGLLELGSYEGMEIVTPRQFIALLESDRSSEDQ